MMRARTSGYVLANLASMSVAVRRGMPVLMLYSSIAIAEFERIAEDNNYHVLPPAPDKSTAECARNLLHDRGWSDFDSPDCLDLPSISLAPPTKLPSPANSWIIESQVTEPAPAIESIISSNVESPNNNSSVADQDEAVMERFDGFVDYIEGGVAYVSLKSREHGDELSGEYSAALLSAKGVKEQNRFICRTVRIGDATRVVIEACPKIVVTDEQIREIDEELNRMLPDDDDVDY